MTVYLDQEDRNPAIVGQRISRRTNNRVIEVQIADKTHNQKTWIPLRSLVPPDY